MLATLTAVLLFGAAAPEPPAADKDAPPANLALFSDEAWYKNQKGDEKDFAGVLSKAPEPSATASFARFNPYRLTMNADGKQVMREVYAGAHPEVLAPYVGKRIKLIGKAVDMDVEGQLHAEIWPSRLQVLDAEPNPGPAVAPPDRIDILASNKVYIADATPEKDYVGVVEKMKGEDAVGYRLAIDLGDRVDRQDLHLFDQRYEIFAPYTGLRVKVTGKKVTGTIRQQPVSYILPARLEVLPVGDPKPAVKELKVLARAEWRPVEGTAPVQIAIRSAKELALAHGQPADRAADEAVQKREAELAARLFKVETIDWKSQMIVVASAGAEPTGGYTIDITGLEVRNDVLVVHWKVNAPKPGDFATQSATHPAQAVLTERFEGQVMFDAPPKTGAGK